MKLVDVSGVLAKYHSGKCAAEKVIDDLTKMQGLNAIVLPVPIGTSTYRVVRRSTGRRLAPRSPGYAQKQPSVSIYVQHCLVTEANAIDVARRWGTTVFPTKEEANRAAQAMREGVTN